MVSGRTLPKEKVARVEKARAEWMNRKVQILIEDDEVPEGHEVILSLEDLIKYLDGLEVPTRIIVDGGSYKVKLRKRVPYEQYQKILSGLNGLSSARWDRAERAIIVKRTKEKEIEEAEQLDVEIIVIAPGEGAKA